MNKEKVIEWLKKAPLSDDEATDAQRKFSYEQWFEQGRLLPDVIDVLVRILQEESVSKESDIAFRAAYALGQIGDKRAGDVLVKALKADDVRLRTEATAALGQLRVGEAFGTLGAILRNRSEDTNVRANACIAIGRLAQPESEALLREAASDSDGFVARCAEEGLKLLKGKD